jgi:topoisomerase-4 subunit A
VRAAKGHDIDVTTLSYRAGDEYLAHAYGRSNQTAVFVDSTGRTYSLPAHSLPSARGLGDPLSGRLTPPDGASFAGVMLGAPESLHVLASDAGYGFVVRLEDVYAKNKAGKVVLNLPQGARTVRPAPVSDLRTDSIAVVTSAGRLSLFPAAELPQLNKGKGLKLVGIPAAALKSREEFMLAAVAVPAGGSLKIYAGQRFATLKPADLDQYRGARGRRGDKLPRGYQRVDRIEVCE